MSPALHQFISIDLPPLLTAVFASLACGLLGNFLVLRRLSLMGDAISHSVLPGIVIAFLITASRSPSAMFIGAAIAGVATVALVELVRRFARLDTGAAMGVTFSVLFALGVLLLEQAAARQVDLDPDCVLHGMLETIFWFPPGEWNALLLLHTLAELPRQVYVTAGAAAAALLFVTIFYKELRLATFDPALATALGFNSSIIHYALMILVAASTVAAFEAVGSILVIAMLICPAATARLLTDRLRTQIMLSALFGACAAAVGYLLGAFADHWTPLDTSLSAAGMMTVTAGAMFALTVVLSPSQGIVARAIRRARLVTDIAREDLLGFVYRLEESHPSLPRPNSPAQQAVALLRSLHVPRVARRALREAMSRNELMVVDQRLALTPSGRRAATGIIRSHRLWETYLAEEAGVRPDHTHDSAMRLEHLASEAIRTALNETEPTSRTDPQGKPIPRLGAEPDQAR